MQAVTTERPNGRRYRRVAGDLRVFTRGTWVPFAEDAHDVSEGGVGITTARPLRKGTRALFGLRLPNQDQVLELRGTVVWSTDTAMGVAFEQQDGLLSDYVAKLRRAEDSL